MIYPRLSTEVPSNKNKPRFRLRKLSEETNKNVLKVLGMHKPLFNERKARINQVEIILKLTEKYTKLNRVKPKTAETFTRN